MMKLLITLVVLVAFMILLIGALVLVRRYRKFRRQALAEKDNLPLHNNTSREALTGARRSNHRRLTISATPYGRKSESVFVLNEKSAFLDMSNSPPPSPVPEIRVTFPEEEDEDKSGKPKSPRVVVVRISESGGVGYEPYTEEHLPPYQSSEGGRFESLDLDRMGGLKEKEHRDVRWS